MKPVEETYGKRFFARRHKLNWRASYVCGAIAEVMKMKKGDSVIDVGCAIGDLVEEFNSLGYKSMGIEGSKAVLPYIVTEDCRISIQDLRLNLDYSKLRVPYNVLTCFEVAEHIEEKYQSQFIINLAGLSDNIVMSAAPPGQGGHGHVNCKLPEYWEMLFGVIGMYRKKNLEDQLKIKWLRWRKKDGIRAFYNNLLIFKRYL